MNPNTATLMQNTFGSPSDVWTGEAAAPAPAEKPQTYQSRATAKRLTIDVSHEMHIRIKVEAALTGVSIGEMLRDMLEKRFPANR